MYNIYYVYTYTMYTHGRLHNTYVSASTHTFIYISVIHMQDSNKTTRVHSYYVCSYFYTSTQVSLSLSEE